MAWKKVSQELIDLLEKSLEPFDCQKRQMFGCPAYFVNNNMFTGAHQDNIFLRLSEPHRNELAAEYDESAPFEPIKGRFMKEYMVLPESLYNDADRFNSWIERSYKYTSGLPEKKKKKKS